MSLHQTLDLVAKILGIVVIVFGVYKYFNDLAESRDRERRQAAMSYVERYNDRDFLRERLELEMRWLPYAALIGQTEKRTLSQKAHARLAGDIALGDAERRMTFEQSMESLTNAVVCSSTGICDSGIIESRFCPKIVAMLELYAPVIAERRKAFLTPDYAVSLEEFARSRCGAPLENLTIFLG
jgi:hypothetical protein